MCDYRRSFSRKRPRDWLVDIDCAGDGDDVEAREHQGMERFDLTTEKFKLEKRTSKSETGRHERFDSAIHAKSRHGMW